MIFGNKYLAISENRQNVADDNEKVMDNIGITDQKFSGLRFKV